MEDVLLIIINIVFWGGVISLIIWRNPDFNFFKFIRKRAISKEKIYDIICFVVGPFITALSIFSHTSMGVGFGIALISIGCLRKYWMNKKITNKGTKIFDVICFVIGPALTIVSLFSFGYGPIGRRVGGLTGLRGFGDPEPPPIFYYPDESKFVIAIGIALICIGVLWKYWKKEETKDERSE